MSTRSTVGTAATGAGVGGAFGGPVGAGIGAGVGALLGMSGLLEDDSAKKALLEKQRQLAAEAQRRREELQRARMQSLTQQMMAFGPRNQVMAQMFGPDAAFTGKQMADMTANPMGPPQADQWLMDYYDQGKHKLNFEQWRQDQHAPMNPDAKEGKRMTEQRGQLLDYARKREQYEREEAARRAQIEAAFGTPRGPAPINPIQAAPARRY
ncbi:MAG TPA: hypothetical protein VFM95_02620 [Microcella sp.]|nr:hypothetical protein [Microcella sp.]